jgi:acyl-CoA dehydrogenase family protein 9
VENVLRKHGEEIAEMQFVQRRVADVAIDLYGLAACLSRTSQAVETLGEEESERQLDHTRTFAALVAPRLHHNIAQFEANDDELRKASAERAYDDNRYALDVL